RSYKRNNFNGSNVSDTPVNPGYEPGFTTGQAVVYDNFSTAGADIGGLQSGKVYYAIVVSPTKLKLADSPTGANFGGAIGLSPGLGSGHTLYAVAPAAQPLNPTTNVNLTPDTTHLGYRHRLRTGDPIAYAAGGFAEIGGLTDRRVYYAIVDETKPTQLKLAATLDDAKKGIAINLTSAPTAPQHTVRAVSFTTRSTDFGPGDVAYSGG